MINKQEILSKRLCDFKYQRWKEVPLFKYYFISNYIPSIF
jgi:hypothetical protein